MVEFLCFIFVIWMVVLAAPYLVKFCGFMLAVTIQVVMAFFIIAVFYGVIAQLFTTQEEPAEPAYAY